MNGLAHATLGINNGCVPYGNFSCLIQLLGVLFSLAAMIYVYRRLKGSTPHLNRKGKSRRELEILETKPLGNRQFLLVVAYEGEKFLLGIHPNGMQFLSKLKSNGARFEMQSTKPYKPHH